VPDRLRGRVLALYGWVFFGTAPLGGYLAGWLAERGGTALTFAVAGGTAVATVALGTLWHVRDSLPPQPHSAAGLPSTIA
jgi:hypothetical protein